MTVLLEANLVKLIPFNLKAHLFVLLSLKEICYFYYVGYLFHLLSFAREVMLPPKFYESFVVLKSQYDILFFSIQLKIF